MARGTVIQEVRPSAGFKTGDFGEVKSGGGGGGGYRRTTPRLRLFDRVVLSTAVPKLHPEVIAIHSSSIVALALLHVVKLEVVRHSVSIYNINSAVLFLSDFFAAREMGYEKYIIAVVR